MIHVVHLPRSLIRPETQRACESIVEEFLHELNIRTGLL